jgi:hypothetical protein
MSYHRACRVSVKSNLNLRLTNAIDVEHFWLSTSSPRSAAPVLIAVLWVFWFSSSTPHQAFTPLRNKRFYQRESVLCELLDGLCLIFHTQSENMAVDLLQDPETQKFHSLPDFCPTWILFSRVHCPAPTGSSEIFQHSALQSTRIHSNLMTQYPRLPLILHNHAKITFQTSQNSLTGFPVSSRCLNASPAIIPCT